MGGAQEHVAHLQRMANEAWRGSPEHAALTAAIAALSAPQSGDRVLVRRSAIESAIETLENDGDEHGEGRNLRAAIDEAAAPQPAAEAQPVGDVGEFGVGIQPNPKARYWQGRAEFWKAQAVALGWREKRDAANGETPPSAPVGVGRIEPDDAPAMPGSWFLADAYAAGWNDSLAQQPAAVDTTRVVLAAANLLAVMHPKGPRPPGPDRDAINELHDALAAQPGGSDNDR